MRQGEVVEIRGVSPVGENRGIAKYYLCQYRFCRAEPVINNGVACPLSPPRIKKNEPYGSSMRGGDKGSRTPDLLNAIQALYQLSYTPEVYELYFYYTYSSYRYQELL